MKLYLVTLGSRGDNEPFQALAREAAQRGHDVHFAHTSDLSRDDTAPYTEWDLPGSISAFIANQGVSVIKALREYKEVSLPLLEGVWEASSQQIRDLQPDVVVYHPKLQHAPVVAHQVGAIAVVAEMIPMLTPTTEFAAAGIPLPLPGWLNRASYALVDAGIAAFGNQAKTLARKLGVDSWTPDGVVCPVSPTLVPQPHDWPLNATVTGQWWTPSRTSLDSELADFVRSGDVLYAGFGSMKRGDPVRRARAIVDAARELGMKALLVTGWGGLEVADDLAASPEVMVRDSVPHDVLLPHIRLAIHHGGAGTVHAFLRAGVPSVIMPFIADQPWWAWRLSRAGLGPKALRPTTRSHTAVLKALRQAESARTEVLKVSEIMAQEHGVSHALDAIERIYAA